MSFIKDEKSEDPRSEIMKEEINIEEATLNLSCVKKELEEFEFPENQCRIALTYENVFGDSFIEKKENIDSLIGFSEEDVVMETEMVTIKLENVKDGDHVREIIEQSSCNGCGGSYEDCASISHIRNNVTPNINLESDLNTTLTDILEIREIAMRRAVFTLKAIPKGIIFGPFEGITPIKGTNGLKWKIKDKKLVYDQNANWMKYIESVTNPLSKNLDIFQFKGLLYFETGRKIQEGEELLVSYGEEKEESHNDEESYLVPVVKEEFPKVFACTLCCLGFHLEQCLVEHKSKCSQGDHGNSIEDFKIIQCHCCKVWLEKQEYIEVHVQHCIDSYKSRHVILDSQWKSTDEINESRENRKLSPPINDDRNYLSQTKVIHCKYTDEIGETNEKGYFIEEKHKCSQCPYQTNRKDYLKRHLNTHKDIKPFECDICKNRFSFKKNLNEHIKNRHTTEKQYKCSQCSYQTNYKYCLKEHLITHSGVKSFECHICKNRFSYKNSLRKHMLNLHLNTNEKKYKCSECSYQTNYKQHLNDHLLTHSGVKSFECNICKNRFSTKSSLKKHILSQHSNTSETEYKCSECSYQTNRKEYLNQHLKNRHSNTSEKEYKCSECSYQTNYKNDLKKHSITHSRVKLFECNICKRKFSQKSGLKTHIKNRHSNTSEKIYKCSDCLFQTNYKQHLKQHLIKHSGVKSLECDICKNRFSDKLSLKKHILSQHSSTEEMEYKCSECPYQTNRKRYLKCHLNTHKNIKSFECEICKNRYSFKKNLKQHMLSQHSNTNEKEYKCSECLYQTNNKEYLSRHIKNRHSNTSEKEYKCS